MVNLLKPQEFVTSIAGGEKKPGLWRHLLIGTVFVSLGATAAAVGVGAVSYRATHIVVNNGFINGRVVRVQTGVNGNIQGFYARPGAPVKTGQVLARIDAQPTPQEEQVQLQVARSQDDQIRWQLERSQLEGEIQANTTQLLAAQESLTFLKNQLQTIVGQFQNVRGVDIANSTAEVSKQQAAVEAAAAKASAARADYYRYQQLFAQGAISKQKADQLGLEWRTAEAEVKQNQAGLQALKATLSATKAGVAAHQQTNEANLVDQRTKLQQAIQAQQMTITALQAKVTSGRQQLAASLALVKTRLNVVNNAPSPRRNSGQAVVTAPFSGIIYSTEREQGERVAQAEPLLSVLDCNSLWVETVVSAEDASKINTQKPVRVQLAGYDNPIPGEVDLIQPISSIQAVEERSKLTQVQALPPAIPANLVGQPLARVTVKIPPPTAQTQSQRFCGLGSSANLAFSKK